MGDVNVLPCVWGRSLEVQILEFSSYLEFSISEGQGRTSRHLRAAPPQSHIGDSAQLPLSPQHWWFTRLSLTVNTGTFGPDF